ncbi:hypothetical protein SAMN02910358_00817 [Lachnospiraceae bacterium XBB1006]|nr:hypothetical protein SAMN02910358_00817 [Lachnospiraceae bacterium XBB1006]
MKPIYEANYDETMETLTQTCELYRLDSKRYTYPIAWACICFFVTFSLAKTLDLKTLSISTYLLYIGGWLLSLCALHIFRYTIGRHLAKTTAIGDADLAYNERIKGRKTPLHIHIQFYEDTFCSRTQSQEVSYPYSRVLHIMESKDALGLVIRSEAGPKGIYSFPKDSVNDGQYDALKNYLVSVCPKIKKIKKL